MKAKVVIRIEGDHRIIKALYKALYPETINPPSQECSSAMSIEEESLVAEIYCNRINLLRAVANSYLSIISMITKSLEVLEDG